MSVPFATSLQLVWWLVDEGGSGGRGKMLERHSSQTLDATDHPVPGQRVDDWAALIGLEVEVYERGRILDRGYVEAVAVDGRILWLSQSGAHTRRL